MDVQIIGMIRKERLKMSLSYYWVSSIGTTTDYLEWPRMAVLWIARYLCSSWASCIFSWNVQAE